jgi:ribosomal protein RSM22 (predicted rRNA methylase)
MSTSSNLPAAVTAALSVKLEGVSRAPLQQVAARMSGAYRAGGHSDSVIRTAEDALVYALVRMPATYAVIMKVLNGLADADPNFAPESLLDLGAGPGTASLAAVERFPSISSLRLIEPNSTLRHLATELVGTNENACAVEDADLRRLPLTTKPADLVLLSYVLAEHDLAAASDIISAARRLATRYLVLIEPGTPHGFARIRLARDTLTKSGARLVAPCPHDHACPLPDDDWCHFSVRLARSKDHRLIKAADVPFEDEPFSYVVADLAAAGVKPAPNRILRQPIVTKGDVTLSLCTATGLTTEVIPRRNKAGYKAAKSSEAGETFDPAV